MKKTIPKIAFIILLIVFVLSTCMTVFAATSKTVTEEQNGVEATLNFNKQEYEANEKVEFTLKVKNNNSYAVKNIQTEIILPSTMKISTGSLTQEAFSLNAGESKLQEIAIEKVVETGNNVPTSNNPQTGDNVVIYIAMMVISATALMVIAVKKKWIHKKGVMSLVLCFTLLGTMALTSVVNAESTSKNFTVEGTIKYDGKDISVKGKVTYMYEVYSKVQIDGVDKGIYREGDTVTITAKEAPEGKHFAGWTVVKGNVTLDNANSSTTTFIMGNEDVEIKTNYEVNTYTITTSSNEGGTITGNTTVNYNGSTTLNITPYDGYHIKGVKIDGESKGTITAYTFENVIENHKIEVVFSNEIDDEESFRVAIATGGIINLASDISITNEDLWVYSKVTINGGIYSISNRIGDTNMYTALKFRDGSELEINNGHFENIYLETGSRAVVNDGVFDVVRFLEADYVEINGGSFEYLAYKDASDSLTPTGRLVINGGTFKRFWVISGYRFTINGGTFYENISGYVDTSTHTVTQTIDAYGDSIWVVTEK